MNSSRNLKFVDEISFYRKIYVSKHFCDRIYFENSLDLFDPNGRNWLFVSEMIRRDMIEAFTKYSDSSTMLRRIKYHEA